MNWIKRLQNIPWFHGDKTPQAFSIPILCYHSWGAKGDAYQGNDHLALESDLKELGRRQYRVIPLPTLVGVLRGKKPLAFLADRKLVGLTCDDGTDFDYYDYKEDENGTVSSLHSILERSEQWLPRFGDGPRAVSFVIASREAGDILDRTCFNGRGEWRDSWWAESAAKNVLGIANHSWDHVHDRLPLVRQRHNKKGSFFEIATFDDAEGQIADAQRYLADKRKGKALPLFCYPYGHVSPYLRDDYFPNHGVRLGIEAAFSTAGASVRSDTNVWDIPRFVCGWHWQSPEEFSALLDAVERGER
ncbi:hypothetical protein [Nitrosococcus watsonii]|uniref:NodB homology domain-containing protein n=1 Tax=Nitrosococcus watsoni (strain C-113) TaxID=105559 RepID=D8K6J0_NITWC|nr:hypothetical protein [Nitrosococcus watsonii]ADJ28517.1 conserved hypothetical protein [Nitrosococcus watsonii C-113]